MLQSPVCPPPSSPNQSYLHVKTVTEFEHIVSIFLGIVGELQLSDKDFHVLRGSDLNKAIKKSPDNRAQVWGSRGAGGQGSAKTPSLIFFLEAFPKLFFVQTFFFKTNNKLCSKN